MIAPEQRRHGRKFFNYEQAVMIFCEVTTCPGSVMTSMQTTKLVGYPWSDLFNLVLDVKSYPIVPRCRKVRLLSHRTTEPGVTIIVSRKGGGEKGEGRRKRGGGRGMTVGFSAFEVSYANRTTADTAGRQIRIEALDGPLRFLKAVWRFEPRDEDHTQAAFFGELRIQQSSAGGRRVARLGRNVW